MIGFGNGQMVAVRPTVVGVVIRRQNAFSMKILPLEIDVSIVQRILVFHIAVVWRIRFVPFVIFLLDTLVERFVGRPVVADQFHHGQHAARLEQRERLAERNVFGNPLDRGCRINGVKALFTEIMCDEIVMNQRVILA